MDVLAGFTETFNDLIKENEKSVKNLSTELGTSPFVIQKWKNHSVDLKLKSIIKLADYFNCSIEFLCGKTRTYLDYTPKECPKFGDWILELLKQCNSSSYKLLKDTSIKPAQFHYWRKGIEPLLSSLEVIAEYLDITLDYLIGRDQENM